MRTRDFWSCQRCHQNFEHDKGGLQGAHIIPKGRYKLLRWDVNNGIALCFACHIRHFHQGGHAVEFTYVAERVIGRGQVQKLQRKADLKQTARFTLADLQSMKDSLEKKLTSQ